MKTKVAVVIPTIDRPGLLRRAIASVARAFRPHEASHSLEIIVVDDAHTGRASLALDKLADGASWTMKFMESRGRGFKGPAACRNLAVRSTDAECIYFLDDDDEFLENRFNASLNILCDADYDVVFEPALREEPGPKGLRQVVTGFKGRSDDQRPFYFLLNGRRSHHVATSALSLRRTAFLAVGGMDESLRYGEDGEFMLRLALLRQVKMEDGAPVVLKHWHGDNVSRVDRLRYWQPVRMLAALVSNLDRAVAPAERKAALRALQGKLDYALTECRRREPLYRRYREGLKALYYFPKRRLSKQNIKSIAVWLTGDSG